MPKAAPAAVAIRAASVDRASRPRKFLIQRGIGEFWIGAARKCFSLSEIASVFPEIEEGSGDSPYVFAAFDARAPQKQASPPNCVAHRRSNAFTRGRGSWVRATDPFRAEII